MKQSVERRLAAILAADVAGYSRLMGADEEGIRPCGTGSSLTHRWREMDSNFRFPDAPSGRSTEARTFSSDREFAPLPIPDLGFGIVDPPASRPLRQAGGTKR